ncbi:hypothetical protein LPUS_12075 [Lasallia pustulata]|uniref:Fungal N-terminal domain-containing protein n=1 Tax=Lasallia pustulata TaxID=136370 RepID=A0A1W5DDV9_9LECA|nr:hypothetical protein LPUS_12075 [Lasallia pustulata]
MLDPLTALVLASNIVQFVDFSIKIAELSKEFKDAVSGLPKDLERIAITVDDLAALVRRLQQSQIGSTATVTFPQTQKYGLILQGCVKEAEIFEKLLLSLKATGRHKGWASFWAALKSVRKGGEIKGIESSLEGYKSQITLRLQEEVALKQNYLVELSDRSRRDRIQEAQDSAEALRQLESTIRASLQQMGNDVRQILQDEANRGPQDATSSEQAWRIKEQVVAEIANFRADFLSLRNELQQVRREAGAFELPVRPGIIQLHSVRSRRHAHGRITRSNGQVASRNQTQVQQNAETHTISNQTQERQIRIQIAITVGVGGDVKEMWVKMKTPPAQPLLAYSPATGIFQPSSTSSNDVELPFNEDIPPDMESGGEDAGQALNPDLPFYESDEDRGVNDADEVGQDDLNETQATTPQMIPSDIDSKLSETPSTEHKPAHHHRHRKQAGRQLTRYQEVLRILKVLSVLAVIFVVSYYLGKFLFPMEEPSQQPGGRGAWCYWKLQSAGPWRYCDWCQKGFEYRDGLCVPPERWF